MASLLRYTGTHRLSNRAVIQTVFMTNAGKVEDDDEWMSKELLADIQKALPKNVSIDYDEAIWYDKPDLHVMFHGADTKQKSDLSFVAVYIDLITNYGLIYAVETEGVD